MTIQHDLLLLYTSLPRALSLEDIIQLLKRSISRLGDDEEDDSGLNGTPNNEDDIGSPLDLLQCDGERELVDHGS